MKKARGHCLGRRILLFTLLRKAVEKFLSDVRYNGVEGLDALDNSAYQLLV